MRPRHCFVMAFSFAFSGLVPAGAHAQQYRPLFRADLASVAVHIQQDTVRASAEEGMDPISASSLFMGVIGALGGAAVGAAALSSSRSAECSKTCRTRNAAAGASIGAGVLIPIGAHVGNDGKGNIFLSALTTAAVGLAGYGIASAVPGHPTAAVVFLTAPIEIILAGKVERATTPAK